MLAESFDFERFCEDGFVIIRGVVPPTQLVALRQVIENLSKWEIENGTAHIYSSDGTLQRVWNLLNKDVIFHQLIRNEMILDALEQIFIRPTHHQKFFLSSLQANILRPGAATQKLHIDTPVPEPLPAWIIKANTMWLMDDFTATNGSTEVVPGSHKLNYKPRANDPILERLQTVIAPAGSVIITHGALWHRSGANHSSASRTVVLGSFAASFAREIANEENIVHLLDNETKNQFDDTLRRIVGIDHGVKVGSLQPPPPRA